MREVVYKRAFRKDYRRISRSGRNLDRFKQAVELLLQGVELPPIYRDHALVGNWRDFRECHLGGDLLLIYQMDDAEIVLVRMGSHSELFD
ncbi:MAG: type II toxin-antitoxin system YafQ family toxin [Verrucomicrobiota bacterium]